MKPRVVLLSAFLTPFRSGAEACVEEVSTRLKDQFDITIITCRMRRDLPKHDHLNGVAVERIGCGSALDPWIFPLLAPFKVLKYKPQIVHAVLETFAGLGLLLCRFIVPSAKRLLTLQTTNTTFLKGPIVRSPDRVTAISSVLVKAATTLGRHSVALIPNGIPYNNLHAAHTHHHKVPGRILFVGRLEPMKGIDTLFRAVAEVRGNKCTVRIVGRGSEEVILKTLVQELEIEDRVTFLGYMSGEALYREYAEAEIFCGLSRSEALGNVFIEAQAAGCAVLATNIGGIPDTVQNGVTGILIAPDDVNAASDALTKLLSDTSLRSSLSSAAQEHAKAYEWDVIAPRYAEVYQSLLV